MKTIVVIPKNRKELKFVSDLLKKLGVGSSTVNQEEFEDIGMSKLMRQVDKSKRSGRKEIMKKLSA
jgi:7-cyano-7-deazaguanine synthase in queuosine biosynthesis